MFRFGEPLYLYLLLLIPLLVAGHYLTNYLRIKRLKRYGDMELLKALMPDVSKYRPEVKFWLMAGALALLIVTLARPQFGTKVDTRKRQGIEAIIAMDISNSMLAQDVTPSRLDKAKMLVSSIVDQMTDDKFFCFFSHFSYCTSYVSCYSHIPNHYIICTIKKEAAFCDSFFFYICSYRLLIAVTSASMEARMISGSTPAPQESVPSGFLMPT